MKSLGDISIIKLFHMGSANHNGCLGSFQIIPGKLLPSLAMVSTLLLNMSPLCALTFFKLTFNRFLLIISNKRIHSDQFFSLIHRLIVCFGSGLDSQLYVQIHDALSVTISTLLSCGTDRTAKMIATNSALYDDSQSVTPVAKKLPWLGPSVCNHAAPICFSWSEEVLNEPSV